MQKQEELHSLSNQITKMKKKDLDIEFSLKVWKFQTTE